jgi:aryl-alcohol dehydrogenase-like predicted oxidoreductase
MVSMNTTTWPRAHGLRLTGFGLGTAQFGNLYQAVSDQDVAGAFEAAWAAGGRYVDTAPHYGLGLSERRLGALLRQVPRAEVVVSSKVGRLLVPSPSTAGRQDDEGFAVPADHRRVWDFSRAGIRRSVEQSLERLGLDRLDIAYLHDPDDHWEIASTEGVGALCELRDEGLVTAIGAGMNQSAMLARFAAETDVDVLMLAGRFSLLDQSAAADLLPTAQKAGVGVVAAGVYNSGILARETVPETAHYNYAEAPHELIERARAMAVVCADHGVTLPEAALAFPFTQPAVVSVVVGSHDHARTLENTRRFAVDVPAALWDDLTAAGLMLPVGGR